MRIFVIGTGRCGTVTFSRACQHITNYTCRHESTTHGKEGNNFEFPDNHIEVDPRLSYFLPSLIEKYPTALYVHLYRNRKDCIESISKRQSLNMYNRFHLGSAMTDSERTARYYYDNTIAIINSCLMDVRSYHIRLETIQMDFKMFWDMIQAEGNIKEALNELKIKHNKS